MAGTGSLDALQGLARHAIRTAIRAEIALLEISLHTLYLLLLVLWMERVLSNTLTWSVCRLMSVCRPNARVCDSKRHSVGQHMRALVERVQGVCTVVQ
jgi:hypothetical protein